MVSLKGGIGLILHPYRNIEHPQEVRESNHRSAGFTLLELLIVIAIIGLLASVAVGAYQGYTIDARATKVLEHFTDAETFVDSRFVQAHTTRSLGTPSTFPASVNDWISEINPGDVAAPSGGPAYVAGAGDALTGAIGVEYSGTFAAGDAQVVLHRPAYSGVTAQSSTVRF